MTFDNRDKLTFTLTEETIVSNDTVKIAATVEALMVAPLTAKNIDEAVNAALKNFVNADWSFSNPNRVTDKTGIERAVYTAYARVPMNENNALEQRRINASKPGLTITNISTDVSVPRAGIVAAESNLRLQLYAAARDECAKFNSKIQATSSSYCIGNMEFERSSDMVAKSLMRASSYSATIGSFADSGPESIAHTEKVVMSATVTLVL